MVVVSPSGVVGIRRREAKKMDAAEREEEEREPDGSTPEMGF